MEITGSSVFMSSNYSKSLSSSFYGSLAVWKDSSVISPKAIDDGKDKLMMSDHAKAHLARGERAKDKHESHETPGMGMIKKVLQDALGVKIGAIDLDEIEYASAYRHSDTQTGRLQISSATATDTASQTQLQTLTGAYDYSSTHFESQKVSLSLEGIIRTKDGQELAFKLDLSVTREFASQTSLSMRASEGSLSTPINVDYNGLAADLGNQLFAFDFAKPVVEDVPIVDSIPQSNKLTLDGVPNERPVPATTAAVTKSSEKEDAERNDNSLQMPFKIGGNIGKLFKYFDHLLNDKNTKSFDIAA